MLDTAIVGAGLCGLALANGLRAAADHVAVFEARNRIGGRILSQPALAGGAPLDLGPTWFWPASQPRITRLVADLGLQTFAQADGEEVLHLKAGGEPPATIHPGPIHDDAQRISGGMAQLVHALARQLPAGMLRLEHVLKSVVNQGDHVELHFLHGYEPRVIRARQVVLAIPPRLLEESVQFSPALDGRMRALMRATPTWMAGSAKAIARFDTPFWREDGHTGNAFVTHPQAVLSETFDAGDAPRQQAALGGFVALAPRLRNDFRAGLPMLVRSQLTQLFGPSAEGCTPLIQDWAGECYTATAQDHAYPDGHPEYGQRPLRLAHWNDKLYFGSSETAAYGGGYMEGALEAAGRILHELALDRALMELT
jgi:monoamine oxidase